MSFTESQLKRRINGRTRPWPKKKWFFEKPYTVTIGKRSEWDGGLHELTRQGLVLLTDGSKTERGIGAVG